MGRLTAGAKLWITETNNRLAETNHLVDLGLDRQAEMSSKINRIDADLTFIHERIDKLDEPKARALDNVR
jgi:hypothetical protein